MDKKGFLVPVSESSDNFRKNVLAPLQKSYLYEKSKESFRYTDALLIKNARLRKKYEAFRAKKRAEGYSKEELKESYGFVLFDDKNKANKLGETGVLTGNSTCTTLGDPSKGAYISKHADCLEENLWSHGKSGYIVIFTLTKGRVKTEPENYTQNFTAPSVGFDCHVSAKLSTVSANTSSFLAFERTQYYMYERLHDGRNETAQSPSHVCPLAIVSFSYMDNKILPPESPEKSKEKGKKRKKGKEGKKVFHYFPWRGQLQIGSQLYCVRLKSKTGALIPAQLPPILKVDQAISMLVLRQLVPKAIFETCFSGEVSLDGMYCSLYELVPKESKDNSLTLLTQELKEKDLALAIKMKDGGFLMLLHSSQFLTYDDAGSSTNGVIQGIFVYPESRTIQRDTKVEQSGPTISNEILQVLPALNYAESEMEKCSDRDTESGDLCGLLEQHIQSYATLINPGLTSSYRESSMFPDQYDVPEAFKDLYSAPKWTNRAWKTLGSYLSNLITFQLPVSKATELLAAGQEEQQEDLDDVYICLSSPDETEDTSNGISPEDNLDNADSPAHTETCMDSHVTDSAIKPQSELIKSVESRVSLDDTGKSVSADSAIKPLDEAVESRVSLDNTGKSVSAHAETLMDSQIANSAIKPQDEMMENVASLDDTGKSVSANAETLMDSQSADSAIKLQDEVMENVASTGMMENVESRVSLGETGKSLSAQAETLMDSQSADSAIKLQDEVMENVESRVSLDNTGKSVSANAETLMDSQIAESEIKPQDEMMENVASRVSLDDTGKSVSANAETLMDSQSADSAIKLQDEVMENVESRVSLDNNGKSVSANAETLIDSQIANSSIKPQDEMMENVESRVMMENVASLDDTGKSVSVNAETLMDSQSSDSAITPQVEVIEYVASTVMMENVESRVSLNDTGKSLSAQAETLMDSQIAEPEIKPQDEMMENVASRVSLDDTGKSVSAQAETLMESQIANSAIKPQDVVMENVESRVSLSDTGKPVSAQAETLMDSQSADSAIKTQDENVESRVSLDDIGKSVAANAETLMDSQCADSAITPQDGMMENVESRVSLDDTGTSVSAQAEKLVDSQIADSAIKPQDEMMENLESRVSLADTGKSVSANAETLMDSQRADSVIKPQDEAVESVESRVYISDTGNSVSVHAETLMDRQRADSATKPQDEVMENVESRVSLSDSGKSVTGVLPTSEPSTELIVVVSAERVTRVIDDNPSKSPIKHEIQHSSLNSDKLQIPSVDTMNHKLDRAKNSVDFPENNHTSNIDFRKLTSGRRGKSKSLRQISVQTSSIPSDKSPLETSMSLSDKCDTDGQPPKHPYLARTLNLRNLPRRRGRGRGSGTRRSPRSSVQTSSIPSDTLQLETGITLSDKGDTDDRPHLKIRLKLPPNIDWRKLPRCGRSKRRSSKHGHELRSTADEVEDKVPGIMESVLLTELEDWPLRKKTERCDLKPVISQCGRILVPHGTVVIAEQIKFLRCKQKATINEKHPDEMLVDPSVGTLKQKEIGQEPCHFLEMKLQNADPIKAIDEDNHLKGIDVSEGNLEQTKMKLQDVKEHSLENNISQENCSVALTGTQIAVQQKDSGVPLPAEDVKRRDILFLSKLKTVLSEGNKRKLSHLVSADATVSCSSHCNEPSLKKSKADSDLEMMRNHDSVKSKADSDLEMMRNHDSVKSKADSDLEMMRNHDSVKSKADSGLEMLRNHDSVASILDSTEITEKMTLDPVFAHALGLARKEVQDELQNTKFLDESTTDSTTTKFLDQSTTDSTTTKFLDESTTHSTTTNDQVAAQAHVAAQAFSEKRVQTIQRQPTPIIRRRMKTLKKQRNLSTQTIQNKWWLHLHSSSCNLNYNVCTSNNSVRKNQKEKVSPSADALTLLADMALSVASDNNPQQPEPTLERKLDTSLDACDKDGANPKPESVLHALLRKPSARSMLPTKLPSSKGVLGQDVVNFVSNEHAYSLPQSSFLLLGLSGIPFPVSPLFGSGGLLQHHQNMYCSEAQAQHLFVSEEEERRRKCQPRPPEHLQDTVCTKKFRQARSFVEKNGSIQVTRTWKENYDFNLDSKFTTDPSDKTVIRALHGPWDFTVPDTFEEVRLIVHMWISLFYSRSTVRFFQIDPEVLRSQYHDRLRMLLEMAPVPAQSELLKTSYPPVPTELLKTSYPPVPTELLKTSYAPVPTELLKTYAPVPTELLKTYAPVPTELLKTYAPVPTELLKTYAPVPTELLKTYAPVPTITPNASDLHKEPPPPYEVAVLDLRIRNQSLMDHASVPHSQRKTHVSRENTVDVQTSQVLQPPSGSHGSCASYLHHARVQTFVGSQECEATTPSQKIWIDLNHTAMPLKSAICTETSSIQKESILRTQGIVTVLQKSSNEESKVSEACGESQRPDERIQLNYERCDLELSPPPLHIDEDYTSDCIATSDDLESSPPTRCRFDYTSDCIATTNDYLSFEQRCAGEESKAPAISLDKNVENVKNDRHVEDEFQNRRESESDRIGYGDKGDDTRVEENDTMKDNATMKISNISVHQNVAPDSPTHNKPGHVESQDEVASQIIGERHSRLNIPDENTPNLADLTVAISHSKDILVGEEKKIDRSVEEERQINHSDELSFLQQSKLSSVKVSEMEEGQAEIPFIGLGNAMQDVLLSLAVHSQDKAAELDRNERLARTHSQEVIPLLRIEDDEQDMVEHLLYSQDNDEEERIDNSAHLSFQQQPQLSQGTVSEMPERQVEIPLIGMDTSAQDMLDFECEENTPNLSEFDTTQSERILVESQENDGFCVTNSQNSHDQNFKLFEEQRKTDHSAEDEVRIDLNDQVEIPFIGTDSSRKDLFDSLTLHSQDDDKESYRQDSLEQFLYSQDKVEEMDLGLPREHSVRETPSTLFQGYGGAEGGIPFLCGLEENTPLGVEDSRLLDLQATQYADKEVFQTLHSNQQIGYIESEYDDRCPTPTIDEKPYDYMPSCSGDQLPLDQELHMSEDISPNLNNEQKSPSDLDIRTFRVLNSLSRLIAKGIGIQKSSHQASMRHVVATSKETGLLQTSAHAKVFAKVEKSKNTDLLQNVVNDNSFSQRPVMAVKPSKNDSGANYICSEEPMDTFETVPRGNRTTYPPPITTRMGIQAGSSIGMPEVHKKQEITPKAKWASDDEEVIGKFNLDEPKLALIEALYQYPENGHSDIKVNPGVQKLGQTSADMIEITEKAPSSYGSRETDGKCYTTDETSSMKCTVFYSSRMGSKPSLIEHLSERCQQSDPTQSSMEKECLIFSEQMNQLMKRKRRGLGSSHIKDFDRSKTHRTEKVSPITVRFSRLQEQEDSLDHFDSQPRLAGQRINVDMEEREVLAETLVKENTLQFLKLSSGKGYQGSYAAVSDMTSECTRSYQAMMNDVCSGKKRSSKTEGPNQDSSYLKSGLSNHVDLSGQTEREMYDSLQNNLNSVVRQACKTKFRFYILVTSDDIFFKETKAQLESHGHTEVEPCHFFLDEGRSSLPLLIIIRNEDIAEHICEVPYLPRLKRSPGVFFSGIDEPDDIVNLTHQEVFSRGGFVVFDRSALQELSLGNVKSLLQALEELTKKGKWKWMLHYRDSRQLKEDARLSAEAKEKKYLIDCCQEAGMMEVLPYHECDLVSQEQPNYLSCMSNLQVQNISARFPVFITDASSVAGVFGRSGILAMNIDAFLITAQSEFYTLS